MKIGQGQFGVIPGYIPAQKCDEWTDIILSDRASWHSSQDHHHYGMAYYVELTSGRILHYHQGAKAANDIVAKLPGFQAAMANASTFLAAPNQWTRTLPRGSHAGVADAWVRAGLSINDTEESIDDVPVDESFGTGHTDMEGLAGDANLIVNPVRTHAFSACVSVAAPESGGGLWIRPEKRGIPAGYHPIADEKLELIPYVPGNLVIFDSFLWHRIERIVTSPAHPHRIVGVCHFLYRPNPFPHWEYWY